MKPMRTNKNPANKNKGVALAIVALIFLFLAGGGLALAYAQSTWPFSKSADPVSSTPQIQDDTTASQEGKQNGKKTDDSDSESKTTPRQIEVGVSFADIINDTVEIRAFTPDVVEGDGTCTATLTKGSEKVTATSQAFIDSTSSQCRPITILLTKFQQAGNWSLTVSYKSANSQGVSESIEVQLP